MRKVLFGIIITLLLLLLFQYWQNKKANYQSTLQNVQLIEQQLKNVSKLVVTEGHFSEVYNYSNAKSYLADYLSFEKKALVVINAEATVSYDLSKLVYEIDEEHKVLRILEIPEEEIKIDPTINYYDMEQSFFNPFTAEDYNTIQQKIREELREKIGASTLKTNAKNRLLSELTQFYALTNSMGWSLYYEEDLIQKHGLQKAELLKN
jgi:phosphoribosyl-ATP pyrophosphohydrolase